MPPGPEYGLIRGRAACGHFGTIIFTGHVGRAEVCPDDMSAIQPPLDLYGQPVRVPLRDVNDAAESDAYPFVVRYRNGRQTVIIMVNDLHEPQNVAECCFDDDGLSNQARDVLV